MIYELIYVYIVFTSIEIDHRPIFMCLNVSSLLSCKYALQTSFKPRVYWLSTSSSIGVMRPARLEISQSNGHGMAMSFGHDRGSSWRSPSVFAKELLATSPYRRRQSCAGLGCWEFSILFHRALLMCSCAEGTATVCMQAEYARCMCS